MTNATQIRRRAFIYLRISQDRDGDGLGVERQEKECRALADRLDWEVVGVFCDNDLSAFSGRRRPDYEKLLAALEVNEGDAVIAWHPDRLHRRAAELERYITLCERHGVANQTVTAGMWDLSTPSGRMVARQLGAVCAYESEHKSERIKAARIQHAKLGRHHGGIRCYGYEKDGVTVVPDEAAEIASACESIASGASLRSIVRDMNSRGVPTTTGKVGGWTSQQLRQTLISPRIAGYSTHKGVIVGTAAWPAIVDDATFRTVEAVLTNPARRTNPGVTGAAKWLGSGLYFCTCGERSLRASVSGGSRRYVYRCAHSSDHSVRHVTRDAKELDKHVEWAIIEYFEKPANAAKLQRSDVTVDVKALRREWEDLDKRKNEASEMFTDGVIDAVQLAITTNRVSERKKEIDEQMAKVGWRGPLAPLSPEKVKAAGSVEAAWRALTLAQRRPILEEVCDVWVLPTTPTTRGFDPDGVRIDWKVGRGAGGAGGQP